jgi:acyl-CoA thioesterase
MGANGAMPINAMSVDVAHNEDREAICGHLPACEYLYARLDHSAWIHQLATPGDWIIIKID